MQLGDLKTAYNIALENDVCLLFPILNFLHSFKLFRFNSIKSEQKWKLLADIATKKCEFGLAQECLHKADDFGSRSKLKLSSRSTLVLNFDFEY